MIETNDLVSFGPAFTRGIGNIISVGARVKKTGGTYKAAIINWKPSVSRLLGPSGVTSFPFLFYQLYPNVTVSCQCLTYSAA